MNLKIKRMARKIKTIIADNIDKREIGYYSTPRFIADYLTQEMLAINPYGQYVLDPAVGKEELLNMFYDAGKDIDSFDLYDMGVHQFSNFTQQNFIEYYIQTYCEAVVFNKIESKYDYIIANPPYNCHEIPYIHDNKKRLNAFFSIGVNNMYSMFLSAMIDMAKDGCVIGVIISDSFLTSSAHAKLRQQIYDNCSIHQIILCPSDLFLSQKADVRTCIMILQKGRRYQKNVRIANRPKNTNELHRILKEKKLKEFSIDSIKLDCNKATNPIIIDVDKSIVDLFKGYPLLGNIFKCVTCISTGNDKKYLSAERKEGFSVPFYKNPASHKFISKNDCYLIDDFMEESLKVKDFMVRNKALILSEGIACSSMGLPFSAVYLPENCVTGVNPTIFPPKEDIKWLLAYLNSSLVTYLIRGVLIRSNMVTSGYVSCLPVISFSKEEKAVLSNISNLVINNQLDVREATKRIDDLIFAKQIVPLSIVHSINDFCVNLAARV